MLAWTGLPQLVLIPFIPLLMKRFDPRWLIGVGFALFAASNFMNAWMTPDYAGDQLLWPNIVRAIGQALAFTPLIAVANGGIEPANAGSRVGAVQHDAQLGRRDRHRDVADVRDPREQFHSAVINPSVSLLNEATRQRLADLQQYFMATGTADPATAWHDAVVAVGRTVRAQSYFLAYGDTFFIMGSATAAGDRGGRADAADAGGGGGAH